MRVLIIVLNNTDYLEEVLSLLVKHNVKGATILESQGMASSIVNNDITNIPYLAHLKPCYKTVTHIINNIHRHKQSREIA